MRNLQQIWQCSGSWIAFLLACGVIFILATFILIAAYGRGRASGSYPSVADLESQLTLIRGGQIPKLVVNRQTGQAFSAYYIAGKDRGNGHYEADILLKPAK